MTRLRRALSCPECGAEWDAEETLAIDRHERPLRWREPRLLSPAAKLAWHREAYHGARP
mgnify:CR=1 FL=1